MRDYKVITALGILLIFIPLQASWVLQHIGTGTLYGIAFPPGTVTMGFVCGANNLLLFTGDSGHTWIERPTAESSGNFNDIVFPADPSTGYIACDSGNVLKTINAGRDWQKINMGTIENLNAVDFPLPSVGYFVGNNGVIIKITDDGDSWIIIPPPMLFKAFDIQDVDFVSADTGWIVGTDQMIYKTVDGANNWTLQNTGSGTLYGVFASSQLNVWAVGENNTVMKSINGGYQWYNQYSPFPPTTTIYSIKFPLGGNDSIGFMCGSSGWVALTTNGGDSWVVEQLDPSFDLFEMTFPGGNQFGWVCGDHEVIFGYRPDIDIEENPPKINERFDFLINPIQNKNLAYSLSLPEPATVSLSLYNPFGQKILSWQTTAPQGTSHYIKNLPNLSQGVYFLKAEVEGYKENKKFIIMK